MNWYDFIYGVQKYFGTTALFESRTLAPLQDTFMGAAL
jgi:hypothetical protein